MVHPEQAGPVRPPHAISHIVKPVKWGSTPTKPDRQPPLVEIRADEDTGLAKIEIEGYAFDPASGKPLDKVDIQVDSRTYTVGTRQGKYYLELELRRGVHEIMVVLHGTKVVLRRYHVRVV